MSWYGATAFCDYYGYRLPTEWEWQAVADYDDTHNYGCGVVIDNDKANYDMTNPLGLSSYPYTSPITHYSPYGYGMNDLAGNVWEWTDIHVDNASPTIDFASLANSDIGVLATAGATPTVSHSIFWDNSITDLVDCTASYSYSEDGKSHYVTQWGRSGSADGQFNHPYQIASDASGRIYVSDGHNRRVQVFNGNGDHLQTWDSTRIPDGSFVYPSGIAIDPSGYVSDTGNDSVFKFTMNGAHVATWDVSQDNGCGPIAQPECIGIDLFGNVYVTDYFGSQVHKFTSDGLCVARWPDAGDPFGPLANPVGVAVDIDGDVYVADHVNDRIVKYRSTDGVSYNGVAAWGGSASGLPIDGACDLALDATGNVYVVAHADDAIHVHSDSGDLLAEFDSTGTAAGEFQYPWGICVSPDRRVYVSDENNHRLQAFKLPCFADATNSDYHLMSKRGRYLPKTSYGGQWVLDEVTSPCVDAGDFMLDPSAERLPNGQRVNIGAYGNTAYASMSGCLAVHVTVCQVKQALPPAVVPAIINGYGEDW